MKVLSALHALQGHPELGKLWEQFITSILNSHEFNFHNTTHDRSIYSGTINGVKVPLLHQVNDFALDAPNEAMMHDIYGRIGKRLQLLSEESLPF